MDDALWERGRAVAEGRKHATPWELDFLRGMHQGEALSELATSLTVLTGHDIRLTSVWLDKTAWVSWVDGAGKDVDKRELADLAVIVRRVHNATIESWMWILQAKRVERLAQAYAGESTEHELDLLHRMPAFELRGTGERFELTKDFDFKNGRRSAGVPWGCEVSTPWTFLDLDADRRSSTSAAAHGYSPIAPRWTAGKPTPGSWAQEWTHEFRYPSLAINSYTRCLEAIIKGTPIPWAIPGDSSAGEPFLPGAPANNQFPEWRRLYGALLQALGSVKTGHASPTKGKKAGAIELSEFLQNGAWLLRSDISALRIAECFEGPRIKYVLAGELDLEGGSSFGWCQTLTNPPASLDAIYRFDEALGHHFGGGFGRDAPAASPLLSDGGGMQVVIADVLGESLVG